MMRGIPSPQIRTSENQLVRRHAARKVDAFNETTTPPAGCKMKEPPLSEHEKYYVNGSTSACTKVILPACQESEEERLC
jgi:hypothetical protein